MSMRLLSLLAVLLLTLTLPSAAAPNATEPKVKAGLYIRTGGSGVLLISRGSHGQNFQIDSTGGNCHFCSLSGILHGTQGLTNTEGGEAKCRIAFSPDGSEVQLEPTTKEECRNYCGMRADFDGVYKVRPRVCSQKNQQAQRDAFLKLYRKRAFEKASEGLVSLLSQCTDFMNQIEIDGVRNDLALSQLHSGNRVACLQTLSETLAAQYSDKENLMDGLPPCGFGNYLQIAEITWHNKSLCEKANSKRD